MANGLISFGVLVSRRGFYTLSIGFGGGDIHLESFTVLFLKRKRREKFRNRRDKRFNFGGEGNSKCLP